MDKTEAAEAGVGAEEAVGAVAPLVAAAPHQVREDIVEEARQVNAEASMAAIAEDIAGAIEAGTEEATEEVSAVAIAVGEAGLEAEAEGVGGEPSLLSPFLQSILTLARSCLAQCLCASWTC